MVFVSVASKQFRVHVSGLESTLADISISVDSKEDSVKKVRPLSAPKRMRERLGRWAIGRHRNHQQWGLKLREYFKNGGELLHRANIQA